MDHFRSKSLPSLNATARYTAALQNIKINESFTEAAMRRVIDLKLT